MITDSVGGANGEGVLHACMPEGTALDLPTVFRIFACNAPARINVARPTDDAAADEAD
jgi:hypothetical protein